MDEEEERPQEDTFRRRQDINANRLELSPATPISGSHHLVRIEKVNNGFIVRVRCQTFVARIWFEVSEGLAEYWDNPDKAIEKYVNAI